MIHSIKALNNAMPMPRMHKKDQSLIMPLKRLFGLSEHSVKHSNYTLTFGLLRFLLLITTVIVGQKTFTSLITLAKNFCEPGKKSQLCCDLFR
jgi:hypothetical protein